MGTNTTVRHSNGRRVNGEASKIKQKSLGMSRAQAEHQTIAGSRIDHQPSPAPAASTINPSKPKSTSLETSVRVCATPTHRLVSLRNIMWLVADVMFIFQYYFKATAVGFVSGGRRRCG